MDENKKGDKQVSRNYQLCGKIVERLIYNNLFELLMKNNLVTSNQLSLSFKQADSYIYNISISISISIYIHIYL